jgi:hypothetical protein
MKNFNFNHLIAVFVIYSMATSAITAQTYDFQHSSIALSGGYEHSNYGGFDGANFNLDYNHGLTEKWNLNLGGGYAGKTYEEVYLPGVEQSLKNTVLFLSVNRSVLGSSIQRHNLKIGAGFRYFKENIDYSDLVSQRDGITTNISRKKVSYSGSALNLVGQYDLRFGKRFFVGLHFDFNPLIGTSKLLPVVITVKNEVTFPTASTSTGGSESDGKSPMLHGLLRFGMFF